MTRYFLYLATIIWAHLFRKDIPIFVTLCVTNRCNLRCLYCYEELPVRENVEFAKEDILSLIDELAKMGTRYISINGGEALLRNDVEEIVDKIRSRHMLCHLSTNGLLVDRQLPALRKVDSIAISIDGIKASNDANRGEGTFDKIFENMKLLKKNKLKFHTHTVLTKNNLAAIEEILSLARSFGFQAQFSLLRVEDSPRKDLGLRQDELTATIKKIMAYKKKGEPVFFSIKAYENFLKWPISHDHQMIKGRVPAGYDPIRCFLKRWACHIEANGLVYPCVVLVNKFTALDFRQVGFRKAWERMLIQNDCSACYNICCSDLNLMFGLDKNSLRNAAKIVLDRLTPAKDNHLHE